MLLGDLLTTVQENLPIKIVVYDNGRLGFVDIEQKAAGLVPVYTDLKNPNFGDVAKAMGLWGESVTRADQLDHAVQSWLVQPGPALLHVKVKAMELVTPRRPLFRRKPSSGWRSTVQKQCYRARVTTFGK